MEILYNPSCLTKNRHRLIIHRIEKKEVHRVGNNSYGNIKRDNQSEQMSEEKFNQL